jgi:hypothetical protein
MLFAERVKTPPMGATPGVLCDWLELSALLSEYGISRIDALIAAEEQQEEEQEEDIGEADRQKDQLIELIENEIQERITNCRGAYPFALGEAGEELTLAEDWMELQYSFYLVCLLTSHLTRNSLLDFEVPPAFINSLRNGVFQTISTLAMAGLASAANVTACAASVGWPRQRGEPLLDVLRRAQARGAGFVVRDQPGEYTPGEEKDGGIDVIAWRLEDRPPPSVFFYAQAASGHNWPGKPVSVHVRFFEDNYFDKKTLANISYATLIPFRELDVRLWIKETSTHHTLVDRTRISSYGSVALSWPNAHESIDDIDRMPVVTSWIADLRNFARQGTNIAAVG